MAGARSPIGEPLAILPPTVPEARTWAEPKRRINSPRSGSSRASAGCARAWLTMAPMARPASPSSSAASSLTRPSQMIFSISRSDLVSHRPTSVEPASSVASGWAAQSASSEARFAGAAKKRRIIADEHVPPVIERRQRRRAIGSAGGERRRGRLRAGSPRRVADRAIAGAAAQIARERIIDHRLVERARPLLMQDEQAHHDARRTEAALRTVMGDHRFLDRMQRAALCEILHGDEIRPVDLAEQQDAGIDRLVDEPPVPHPSERDSAGAAIALPATLLGAERAHLLAQIIEQRGARMEFGNFAGHAVAGEADRLA